MTPTVNNLSAASSVSASDMEKVRRDFEDGLQRVEGNLRLSRALQGKRQDLAEAMRIGNSREVRRVISEICELDDGWKRLAEETGFSTAKDDNETAVVCAGLCIFFAGVAVGAIIGAAVSKK